MAEQKAGTASSVEHAGQATAAINAPVRLYDEDGRAIIVEHADLVVWLGRGYALELYDDTKAAKEAIVLATALAQAVKAIKDPADAAALAAVRVALDELGTALDRVDRGRGRQAVDAEPVYVRHAARPSDAPDEAIDPNQVEHYKTHGWAPVTGGDK